MLFKLKIAQSATNNNLSHLCLLDISAST